MPVQAWREVFLNVEAAQNCTTAAEALASGHSVFMQMLASRDECKGLKEWASSIASAEQANGLPYPAVGWDQKSGRTRLPVASMQGCKQQKLCETLLLRSLALFEQQAAGLNEALFGRCPQTIRSASEEEAVWSSDGLLFSAGEPAINVYTDGGDFRPHQDKQSITILLVLSEQSEFEGGGTAFWSHENSRLFAGKLSTSLSTAEHTEPTMILRPPAGTALCFGGSVTHAGCANADAPRAVPHAATRATTRALAATRSVHIHT